MMNVHMLMVVIGPMLVPMAVRRAWRRQILGRVGMRAQMMRVIVAKPARARLIVGRQQALAMMPAALIDIEILLALRRALVFGEAVPLAVRMLLDQRSQFWHHNDSIA